MVEVHALNVWNEFSPLKMVLVSPTPDQYVLNTELIVNPIQQNAVEGGIIPDPELAKKQHQAFTDTLRTLGIDLVFTRAKPADNTHNVIFTRDIGAIIGEKFLPSIFRYDYRQSEVEGFTQLADESLILQPEGEYKMEGGDIAILESGLVAVGISPRTNTEGLEVLRRSFPKTKFMPVEVKQTFHLDTAMGVLGDRHLVVKRDFLPDDFIRFLVDKKYRLVDADPQEYLTCCTNVLAINHNIVIAARENVKTNARLKEQGVYPIEVSLSEILMKGGGPHCLSLPLYRK
jgi:N-dimethylarginine dimethylaminohydrolase